MGSGIELIRDERARQATVEYWDNDHDDTHVSGELVIAAMSYAECARKHALGGSPHNILRLSDYWPWDMHWWKPSLDPIKNLVKAGALIAAEIDRLQRKEKNASKEESN